MKIPELNIEIKDLYDLSYGTTRSWLLLTAIELKVFNLTAKKNTAAEVAAALKSHEANTELFLNALCSIGLLNKKNGEYWNTELSNAVLIEGQEPYLGESILMNNLWNFQSQEQMKQSVLHGPMPKEEAADYSGDYFADYVITMKNFAISGISQQVAKEISSLPEFPGIRKMIDLGGSHGMDCMAIASKNPDLKGIVFDKPAVVEVTQKIISEYEMEDQVTVMGGDYAEDPIGSGYDLIYAKATMNFFKDNLKPLFEKIYNALNPGGLFVSIHDGVTDEKTQPAEMIISWLPTSMTSIDFSLEQDLIPNAMLESGFKSVRTKTFPFSMAGKMDINIGRK